MQREIKILDHGYVKLIDSWGSDESIIEAARMSTQKGFLGWGTYTCDHGGTGGKDVYHTPGPCEACGRETVYVPGDEKLLSFLYKNKHDTPFEMAGAIFEIKAPIFVFREWHRHRTQSYNEMSARYIPLPNENYMPDALDAVARSEAAAATANKQQRSAGVKVLDLDTAICDLAALALVYDACQAQYERMLANGWPKELARCPVPVARYSVMRAGAVLRNWLGFLTLRDAPTAQKEIRLPAHAVGDMLSDLFPRTMTLYQEGGR